MSYKNLVVEPLEKLASQSKGALHVIGDGEIVPVYMFERRPGLFVTSMHHANEIFGTYNSVISALSFVPMTAVPVVNADYFDKMCEKLKWAKDYSAGNEELENSFIYEFMHGYKDMGPDPRLYPPWGKWNYGGAKGKKPAFIDSIETAIINSALCMDVHNSTPHYYFVFKADAKSAANAELQEDAAQTVKNIVTSKGFSFGQRRRVTSYSGSRTLIDFCSEIGVAGICLEVPIFRDGIRGGIHDQSRISDANIEIMVKIAELVS